MILLPGLVSDGLYLAIKSRHSIIPPLLKLKAYPVEMHEKVIKDPQGRARVHSSSDLN